MVSYKNTNKGTGSNSGQSGRLPLRTDVVIPILMMVAVDHGQRNDLTVEE